MKKIIFTYLLIIFLFPALSEAQSISRYSISSASGFYSDNVSLDFSVGQIITPSIENSQLLTSGFQQPENQTIKDTPESEFINYEINIFPNPTITFTNIIVTSEFDIEQIDINIYDMSGKEIFVNYNHQNMKNYQKIHIDFSNFDNGSYLILITINQFITKNITLIKQ